MLSKSDVDWIRETRHEIIRNRTFPITLIGESEQGKHPITGEPITKPVSEDVDALVTEVDSAFKTDISLEGGIRVEKGDLRVDIDIDEYERGEDSIHDYSEILHDNTRYTILAADKGGLGKINRVIIVARKVS